MVTKLKPYNPSASELESDWHVIDAQDKVLGRLASEAAMLLMGKHRPEYVPHLLSGDFVVITNAGKIKVTGNKADQIVYRRHSQKPGKLKEIPYRRVQAKTPTRIIEHAVRGMLPKNKLGERMIRRLKVYAGEEHPHVSQIAWTEQRPERDAKAALEAEEAAKKRAAARERSVAKQQIAEDAAAKTAAADKAKATTAAAPEATEAAEPKEKTTAAKKPAAKKPAAKTTAAKASATKTASKPATSTRKKADTGASKSADAKSTAAKPKAAAKKPAAKKPAAKKPAAKKPAAKKPAATRKPATAKKDE